MQTDEFWVDVIPRQCSKTSAGNCDRSLVGLDRLAAKAAFQQFLDGRPATASQIQFINMIVEHVAEQGWMDPDASPFVDISPQGRRAPALSSNQEFVAHLSREADH